MKKIALAMASLAVIAMSACNCKDTYTTDSNVLPKEARTLIASNYPDAKIAQIKVDKEAVGGDEYEVTLANGAKVDFNADGSIDKVTAAANDVVPAGFIPANINAYLAANYPNEKVVKYEVDKNNLEVKLANGLELQFDLQGNFVKIDD